MNIKKKISVNFSYTQLRGARKSEGQVTRKIYVRKFQNRRLLVHKTHCLSMVTCLNFGCVNSYDNSRVFVLP